jgi:hypothetical protein
MSSGTVSVSVEALLCADPMTTPNGAVLVMLGELERARRVLDGQLLAFAAEAQRRGAGR